MMRETNISLKCIFDSVSKELDLPVELVEKVYKAYWTSIREHITSLPLKGELSDEDFYKLKTSVNIPSIGKLYVNLDRCKKIKSRYRALKEKRDAENKED